MKVEKIVTVPAFDFYFLVDIYLVSFRSSAVLIILGGMQVVLQARHE